MVASEPEWKLQLVQTVSSRTALERAFRGRPQAAGRPVESGCGRLPDDSVAAAAGFPMKITPYYLSLAHGLDPLDPICRQVVPSGAETEPDPLAVEDPIGDRCAAHRPAETVIHRHRDRVLLVPTWQCAVHCRYCFRRGRGARGHGRAVHPEALEEGLAYIRSCLAIREVILTGGDPLVLDDEPLAGLVARLAGIPHLRVLRIHSRIPAVNPFRVTQDLCRVLNETRLTVWIVAGFNHPVELTAEAAAAAGRLVDAGIPVLSQAVLLRGVNDDAEVLENLFLGLIEARIKPYYLHHPDRAPGTRHLRVSLRRGVELLARVRPRVPGYAFPRYVLDIPGGHGKIPVEPSEAAPLEGGVYRLRAPDGSVHLYRDAD